MDKSFSIVDSSIVNTEMSKIIDEIFDDLYRSHDEKFEKLIRDLTVKDDKTIKSSIINVYHSLINLINRGYFLDSYMSVYYESKYVDSLFQEYEDYILRECAKICSLLEELEDEIIDGDKLNLMMQATEGIRNARTYDEVVISIDFKLPIKSDKTYTEYGMELKKRIDNVCKEFKKKIGEPKNVLINHYLSTKDYVEVIIRILKELDKRIMEFKIAHNAYEFNDIALKAIELVRDNPEVAEEIRNKTFEIMIDEYQDTNDIQETFISFIENNNVYMVGDIKQSIYRFRNANPYIFKSKYDRYKEGINGFKIDLNKNFRSRNEVINNINLIFNNIMFDEVGGAKYEQEHQMIFGNDKYNTLQLSDYNMEILNYNNDNSPFKKEEVECFILAEDILRRVKNKEQVVYFTDDGPKSRDIEFSDIVI
ncbi:MAG: UvrD-helicase domain-containing protein, partial [Bacilli bacterium]|nr:UvrD-helicase domain-containing protein [Bacilli bacterium]